MQSLARLAARRSIKALSMLYRLQGPFSLFTSVVTFAWFRLYSIFTSLIREEE